MSNFVNVPLGKQVESMDVSPQFDAYSGVEIIVDDDTSFFAGNRSGRVLSIQNAWGTQAQAQNILASLTNTGFQYQPFSASKALLNPAAEIGDAVTVNGIYSGVYKMSRRFGPLTDADIEAPQDEELDHEYPFAPMQDRVFKREIAQASAQITLTQSQITAEVSRATQAEGALSSSISVTANQIKSTVASATSKYDTTGLSISLYGYGTPAQAGISASGNSNKLYLDQNTGYYYKSNGSTWTKQNNTALKLITTNLSSAISQQAGDISAKVSQTGGNNSSFGWSLLANKFSLYSGNKEVFKCTASGVEIQGKITATSGQIGGFTIGSSSIYKGTSSISSGTAGVYVGTNGIRIVGSSGSFTANASGSVTMTGTLNIGGTNITAAALRSGAQSAYNNSSYWSGGVQTADSALSKANSAENKANTAIGYFSGLSIADNMIISKARIGQLYLAAAWRTIGRTTIVDGNGVSHTVVSCT